jgi:cell wall-associated NlpC family hydrolase
VPPTRTFSRVLSGVVLSVAVLLTSAGHAYADPTAAQIEAQIEQEWNQLEPIIEQYNQVHSQLMDNQNKATELQKQLLPLQLQVDLAMSRVDDIASRYYVSGQGGKFEAMLTSNSPTDFAEKLMMLNGIAYVENQRIAAVAKSRDKLAADKKTLDTLVAQLGTQDAQLSAKKTDIQARLDSLQKLRLAAYGASGTSGGTLKPVPCPQTYLPGKGGVAASKACSLIGHAYSWGAAGPKYYDCSGLTMTAWAAAGVTLGHFTDWQWSESKPITAAQLQPGDLIFFYSDHHHVGIYIGNGWMVHAPTTGDYVREAQIAGRPVSGYRRPG